LLYPVGIRIHASSMLVADYGAKRLSVHDRTTGRQLRTVGREGSGPGEFRELLLLPAASDRALVYDRQLARLSWWSGSGDAIGSRSTAGLGSVSGVCGEMNGTLTLKISPAGESALRGVGELDSGATTLRNLRQLPPPVIQHRSDMGSHAHLLVDDDGECILAPHSYAWIATVQGEQFGAPMPLIETVPPPRIVEEPMERGGTYITTAPETPDITRMLAFSKRRAYVSADGKTTVRRRVIDIYQRRPWRYEGSLVVPGRIMAVGARDSLLALVQEDSSGLLRLDVFVVRDSAPR
jgi:hypothetical protein